MTDNGARDMFISAVQGNNPWAINAVSDKLQHMRQMGKAASHLAIGTTQGPCGYGLPRPARCWRPLGAGEAFHHACLNPSLTDGELVDSSSFNIPPSNSTGPEDGGGVKTSATCRVSATLGGR